ncbi:MAG: hypothetical protein QHC90_01535 [Shinella sp.]|nr:hypothetical protein [Shinella sp.]
MKSAFIAALLVASPAFAQSPDLENACIQVAKNFLLTNHLKTGVVQSFPELKPPGARLTYSSDEDADPNDMTDEIDCEFEKAEAPFGLVRFCISRTCYSADEQDPMNRRRFQEVKILMDRQKP